MEQTNIITINPKYTLEFIRMERVYANGMNGYNYRFKTERPFVYVTVLEMNKSLENDAFYGIPVAEALHKNHEYWSKYNFLTGMSNQLAWVNNVVNGNLDISKFVLPGGDYMYKSAYDFTKTYTLPRVECGQYNYYDGNNHRFELELNQDFHIDLAKGVNLKIETLEGATVKRTSTFNMLGMDNPVQQFFEYVKGHQKAYYDQLVTDLVLTSHQRNVLLGDNITYDDKKLVLVKQNNINNSTIRITDITNPRVLYQQSLHALQAVVLYLNH